jgi:hypothetical protein
VLRRIAIGLLALGIVIVFLGGPAVVLSSADFQQCEADGGYYPTAEDRHHEKPPLLILAASDVTVDRAFLSCWGGWANANGSAVTAIATGFLGTITLLLFFMAVVQNDATAMQHRAYVSVRGYEPVELGGRVLCVVIWENAGNTPTKTLKTWVNWGRFREDIDDTFDYPDLGMEEGRSQSHIGPHATISTQTFSLAAEDVRALHDETAFMYLWGWAEYHDIFPGTPRHRTEFCARVTGQVEGDRMLVGFLHHHAHNSAD